MRDGAVAPSPGGSSPRRRAGLPARACALHVFAGIPALVAVVTVSGGDPSLVRHGALAANLLLGLGVLATRRPQGRPVARVSASVALGGAFLTYLVGATLWAQVAEGGLGTSPQLRAVASLVAWLLPALCVFVVTERAADLGAFARVLRRSLAVVSLSVYACAAGAQVGIRVGEALVGAAGGYGRYFGPVGDQVGFVSLLGVFLAMVYRRWRWCALHAGAVLLTGTRAATVSLLVGTGLMLVSGLAASGSRVRRSTLRAALVLTAIVAVLAVSPLGNGLRERWLDREVLRAGVSARTTAYALALEAVSLRPLLGAGYGRFTEVAWTLGAAHAFESFNAVHIATAANQYLQVLVDGGVLGLLAFAAFVAAVARDAWALRRLPPGAARSFCEALSVWAAALLIGFQSGAWILPTSLIALYFFAVVALLARARLLLAAVPTTPAVTRRAAAVAGRMPREHVGVAAA